VSTRWFERLLTLLQCELWSREAGGDPKRADTEAENECPIAAVSAGRSLPTDLGCEPLVRPGVARAINLKPDGDANENLYGKR